MESYQYVKREGKLFSHLINPGRALLVTLQKTYAACFTVGFLLPASLAIDV
jgi:hypothetical protein